MLLWTATAEWPGETAFIVAGGPSVAEQNLDLLRDRKVIVINSSYERVPWADFLYFGDSRWWNEHKANLAEFKGRIVSTAPSATGDKRVLMMRKNRPPGLSDNRQELTCRRTSLAAAINLAAHLGAKRIVLLGADGRLGNGGQSHHHVPHKWGLRDDCFDQQREDLQSLVKPLAKRGIEVLNASPGSALPFWPIVSLEDVLCPVASS